MEKDLIFHKEEDLKENMKVQPVLPQNIQEDDVLEKQGLQVKKEAKSSTTGIKKQLHSSHKSDTPVEENEDAMLPEDGVLLTCVLKMNQREQEGEAESVIFEDKVCGEV